jgi:hypothetical protein
MNGDGTGGLGHGRDWSVEPAGSETFEWSIDPQHGMIQGPLDLGFLRGHRMALNLAPDQVALLVEGQHLHAVYLDGGHILDIGGGDGQIPPDCRLIFLTLGRGLEAVWTRTDPVDLDGSSTVIGRCTVVVTSPGRFFDTFLAGLDRWDEGFLVRLLRQRVHAALAAVIGDATTDAVRLQTLLTRMAPTDLDDELEPCGLSCVAAAFYTAKPPVEDDVPTDAGQFIPVRHN